MFNREEGGGALLAGEAEDSEYLKSQNLVKGIWTTAI